MILTLYGFLIAVSLVLIIIGLARPTESAQAIIGFTFLFLLSFVLINGTLEVETGANVTSNLIYNGSDVIATSQNVQYTYTNFNDTTSHRLGIYFAFGSGLGLAGTIAALGVGYWRKRDD
jgi:hypothetical protein